MATFYGRLKGNRGAVTRMGSASSGIQCSAQSWNGSLVTSMYEGLNGETRVDLSIAEGSSAYGRLVFSGSLKELEAKLAK